MAYRRSSGPVTRRRFLLGLGATLSVGGVASSGAFSSATADRLVSVGAASDPNALLGLDGVSDAGVTPTFTNNTDGQLDVVLESTTAGTEFDVGNTGNFQGVPVQFTLAGGETVEAPINADADPASVGVTGTILDGERTTGTIELQRDYAVPASGQVVVTPSVQSTGNSGKYEFGLENTGSIDATMVGLGINQTTEQAAAKVGAGGDPILVHGGNSIVDQSIPIDSTDPATATVRSFTQSVTLNPTEGEKTFEFDRVRTASDKNAKMNNEDVEITVAFSDGSSTTVNLCPQTCSF